MRLQNPAVVKSNMFIKRTLQFKTFTTIFTVQPKPVSVNQLVLLKNMLHLKTFVATCALKRPLAVVHQPVHHKTSPIFKTFAANIALKRPLASVDGLVPSELLFILETFDAKHTLKRTFVAVTPFVFIMDQRMPHEDPFLSESFIAELAFEWSIVSVNQLVSSQILFVLETFAAHRALKLTLVGMK